MQEKHIHPISRSGVDVLEELQAAFSRTQDRLPDSFDPVVSQTKYIGPVYAEMTYEFARVNYKAVRVENPNAAQQTLALLEAISRGSLFGKVKVENGYENFQSQPIAFFVRSIAWKLIDVSTRNLLVANTNVKSDDVLRAWFAGAYHLSAAGLPAKKFRFVRPVALQTKNDVYRLAEDTEFIEYAKDIPVNGQLLFYLPDAKDKAASSRKAMELFFEELKKQLAADPIGATKSESSRELPGEFVFVRDRLRSLVLLRTNFLSTAYEYSTYTAKWYSVKNRSATPDASHQISGKGAVGSAGPNIYLDIEHDFWISADGKKYRDEPNDADQMPNFLAAYRRALGASYNAAKLGVVRRLAGRALLLPNGTIQVQGDLK